jgi:hypothetical protein
MSENNGKDPMTGHFAPGNRVALGNRGGGKAARRMRELRELLIDCATDDDVRGLYKGLLASAKDGDTAAARVLLEYLVGKAAQPLEISGIDGGSLGLDVTGLTRVVLVALAGMPEAKLRVAEALGGLPDADASA